MFPWEHDRKYVLTMHIRITFNLPTVGVTGRGLQWRTPFDGKRCINWGILASGSAGVTNVGVGILFVQPCALVPTIQ